MRSPKSRSRSAAITVVAILAVLVVAIVPAMQRSFVAAQRAECSSNMRQIGTANYLFADGHVESIDAGELQERFARGENIALPPDLEF